MAVIKVKPTSPGRRAVVKVVHAHLHKGKPEASLLEPQMQNAGRNNNGHITIRHKGGGHKHHYRVVDVPAERAIWAPLPGSSSMQWMIEPTGMLRIGSVLPALIGASAPDTTVEPTSRPRGAMM